MGVDITVKILAKQKDGSYAELRLYRDDSLMMHYSGKGMVNINEYAPYCDRNYALFDILAGQGRGRVDIDEPLVSERGMFEDAPDYIKSECAEYGYGASYADWCELTALAQLDKAEYYNECSKEYINPVKDWVKDIDFVLNCYGYWYPKPGEIVVVYWFDC